MSIRKIRPDDDASLARIIRNALQEFNANKPGTVFFDASTDHLSEVFQTPKSRYFVWEENGEVLGGAGFYPTDGLDEHTCELVKMYLSPKGRGKGLGQKLLNQCMTEAKHCGFKKMYIETMPELTFAIAMYEKNGFQYLMNPLGNSGHTGCDVWMEKEL